MRKLMYMALVFLLLAACSNESGEDIENEVAEDEENEGEQVEKLDKTDVADILKETIGTMSTELEDYFSSITSPESGVSMNMKIYREEYPHTYERELEAIITKGAIETAKEKIIEQQNSHIEASPHHFYPLFYLHASNISLPLEIIEEDESSFVITYYNYGEYSVYNEFLTSKITLNYQKNDDEDWMIKDYTREEGIEELGFQMTRDIVEESYDLQEYLLDETFTITWDEQYTHNNRDMLAFSVNDQQRLIDVQSGLVMLPEFASNMQPNVEKIIQLIKERNY